jgi:tetratricopeptide (TPR) repeat protein
LRAGSAGLGLADPRCLTRSAFRQCGIIAIMSTSPDERLATAVHLRESGQLEEMEQARRLLLELRTEFPDDARVALQTAWAHDTLGLEAEAVPHYEAALARAGDLSDDELRNALLGLGSTFRTLGRYAESDRMLRQGIGRFPDYRPFRVFHALTAYNLGRSRDAVEQLLKLLLETTSDAEILEYRRALGEYAENLDRT